MVEIVLATWFRRWARASFWEDFGRTCCSMILGGVILSSDKLFECPDVALNRLERESNVRFLFFFIELTDDFKSLDNTTDAAR